VSKTLLQILDTVNDRMAFARTSGGYAASTTIADRNLVSFANTSASVLRQLPLTRLIATGSITMSALTTYSLPADFLEFTPDTGFMASNLTPVQWPTPPDVWNQYQAGNLAPGAVLYVRQIGTGLSVLNPVNGIVLTFEYRSTYPIAATATPTVPSKAEFTVDTDVWLLDDELIIKDVQWRAEKHNAPDSSDWQVTRQEFNAYLHDLLTRVQGARTIAPGQGWPVGVPYADLWRPA
jgi:hypothetical protein